MMNRRTLLNFLLVGWLLLLTACGGGNDKETTTPDTTPPVITLIGDADITLNQGEAYIEQGATAIDNKDGDVALVITGSVDVETVGEYQITYSATDEAGNRSNTRRTITVIAAADTEAPVITLIGDANLTLFQGEDYVEQGATAIDNKDGDVAVVITGSVDVNIIGDYQITYSATDNAGNSSNTSRTITVIAAVDTEAPVITLIGDANLTLFQGEDYVEQGATATDNKDGNVEVVITGSVDVNIIGDYQITYSATDNSENSSNVIRLVSVIADTEAPVITLNGASDITFGLGREYIEPGATAIDNKDGEVNVTITGNVDSSILGTYILTYTATDIAGNSSEVIRTINIVPQRPFITTWNTENTRPGSSEGNDQITISTLGGGKNYRVDWGDGTSDENVTGDITHTYATPGIYTVSISGIFRQIHFGYFHASRLKLLTIEQWGDIKWQSMSKAFEFCENLTINAIDSPDLSNVIDMSYMFKNAYSFNQDISHWDVSNVTNMSGMFSSADSFNQDIGAWDVSSVTDMSEMFSGADDFNQGIEHWDVSNVTNMYSMFTYTKSFNQDIGAWDVSNVTNMSAMFANTSAFNGDISSWDVSQVLGMSSMFREAKSFNGDISSWDVSNVIHMVYMFSYASSFNQYLGNWNVSNVKDMARMFEGITLSTEIYDALLLGWSQLSLQSNVDFSGGNSHYSALAQEAIDILAVTFNWDITDNGLVDEVYTDSIPPVLWLNGQVEMSLFKDEAYIEQGARANDNKDGDVTVVIAGFVDTNTAGIYQISYTATDSAGNSKNLTRTISVANDTTAPDILLIGNNFLVQGLGREYVELGAIAIDNKDGEVEVTITGTVDVNTLGSYILTYSAIDSVGNTSDVNRIVNILPPRPFITTWQTNNTAHGSSANDQIKIGTLGAGYNYSVDWGDGTRDDNVAGDIIHTYATEGVYTVAISGEFPQLFLGNPTETFYYEGDSPKLLAIEQWGDIKWRSMHKAFYNTNNMTSNALDKPDLSNVSDMSYMFYGARWFNQDIRGWDVSNVTDMSYMFYDASSFNQDIRGWDVSNVTDMSRMFRHTKSFNKDIGAWDVSNVTDMSYMFAHAGSFNQDIGDWEVANVTNMAGMFRGAYSFTQDISNWDVANVTNMAGMFWGADSFNQDISNWDVVNVTNMAGMFWGADSFNQDISNWDVANVTNMAGMFKYTESFNQDIGLWDVSNVIDMSHMFSDAESFNQDIGLWDVSNVTDMSKMFMNANSFNQTLDDWNVSNVINMNAMFESARDFNQFIKSWDVSKVTDMARMFMNTNSFDQRLNSWDVSSVSNMNAMFESARDFNNYIGNWDVSNVIDMSSMFKNASKFNQSINNWDVSKVTNMSHMFNGAVAFNSDISNLDVSNLTSLAYLFDGAIAFNQDISAWDVSGITNMVAMFRGAKAFNQPLYDWDVSNVTNMGAMFHGALAFNQDLSYWDVSNVIRMDSMFREAAAFDQNLGSWNISNIERIDHIFEKAVSFNQDISRWDVSEITNMRYMFANASAFNQDISGWDISNVVTMDSMFKGATAFDQNLGEWDVSNIGQMGHMFEDMALSTENYDALLYGWSSLPLKRFMIFHAGNSKYSQSAQSARDVLTETFDWRLTDGGIADGLNQTNSENQEINNFVIH